MITTEVVRKCQIALKGHYGSQLKGLVLYGSVARDQADIASDIDLLVLLSKPFDYFQELRRIIDLLGAYSGTSDQAMTLYSTKISGGKAAKFFWDSISNEKIISIWKVERNMIPSLQLQAVYY